MTPQLQNAIFVEEVGKPMVLGQRPIPEPPRGFIRVKVTATMLLPHDTYGRDFGLFIGESLPYILGSNIAGTVDKVGEGVTSLQVGDQIFGQGDPNYPTPDSAGLQQYAILDAEATAKIPSGFTAEQMVSFPINAATSFEALFHETKGFNFPVPSQSIQGTANQPDPRSSAVVIIGGGSNVGKLAIQFARIAGIGKIIVVASVRNEAQLKALGATHVIDRHAESKDIARQIRGILPDGAFHIYDCVSWEFSLALAAVSRNKPSTILTLHPADTGVEEARKAGLSQCTIKFVLGRYTELRPILKQFYTGLPTLVKDGEIQVPEFRVIQGLDLERLEKALDDYRDGSPVLPVVVRL